MLTQYIIGGNNAIRAVRILYTDEKASYELMRDRPMFAEVEFVPSNDC